jgi:hypothetical protein
MSFLTISQSMDIDAPGGQVYGVLSDYRKGHPAILPKPYFTELTVEEGGIGAGTVIRVGMKAMGVSSRYLMIVTEPEPGRVLVEADADAGVTTTFTVELASGEPRCRVTISTNMPLSRGVKGALERLVTPPVTRRIFRKQLRQLARYMAEGKA